MGKEIWKDVLGYKGHYLVSNKGRMISLKFGRRVMVINNTERYPVVNLTINGKSKLKRVHVSIAESFMGHTPSGHKIVVDHIDNNTRNNNIENLQLVSTRENTSRRKRGKSKYTGVSLGPRDEKWKAEIYINGKPNYLGLFDSEKEASNAYQKRLKLCL